MSKTMAAGSAAPLFVGRPTPAGAWWLNESIGDDIPAQVEPGTPLAEALERASAARAPWGEGWTEALIAANERCLTVVVADTDNERNQGLRDVTDFGAYDGMLFVFPNDIDAQFTMANTPTPLDIDWYRADGSYVSSEQMTPCPEGNDGSCPLYGATDEYR